MSVQHSALVAFNRGLVSRLGLARSDIKRIAFSAEQCDNWMPRRLGSMMLVPGLKYIATTKSSNAARYIPFIFATTDVALIEFTNTVMRVLVNDTLVTRVAVSTAVTNGTFDTDLSSWTDNDQAGGVSAWVAGGYMGLTGDGTNFAIRDQTVTVAGADQNKEHALRIVVNRGPVTLRVGTSTSDDSYINETALDTGTHSLAFTPTGNFNIRLMASFKRQILVDSVTVEASGVMEITSPYTTSDLNNIVAGPDSQSGDIIFVSCSGFQGHKIERRATHSWSLVTYQTQDGPFELTNSGPITVTPSALSGNVTLTASAALWRSTHVGALWRVTSSGQSVSQTISAQNTFTNTIEVTGTGTQRAFAISITGLTGTGSKVTLQQSLTSSSGPWSDFSSYTANTTTNINDALDNQIVWYQLGVKTGDYVAGTIVCSMTYAVGSVDGYARITAFSSSTSVSAEVFTDFGGTAATNDWAEGSWSDHLGWPTSTTFFEGRLWWAGKNGVWGSVSDAFYSFLDTTIGDSGPINRTVGSGPVDTINWILPLQRLILGAQGAEFSCRASSLDEILTPSNFNIRPASTQGSAGVQAVKIDSRAAFVQRGGTRLFELSIDTQATWDYTSNDLTSLIPEVGSAGISRIAVQRQPETRIHCVLGDGTVAILVYDPSENLICWVKRKSDGASGIIEDVCVLPGASGTVEDQVYYVVKRTINGSTVRYLEKWALESECRGDAQLCNLADSFISYTGAATTTITGLSTLEGQNVVVWADGADVGSVDAADGSVTQTYTVSSGQISLATAASNVVVGLPYTAQWKSGKLVHLQTQMGTPLTMQKNIRQIGMIMADVHPKGILFGADFNNLDSLPGVEEGSIISTTAMRTNYDETTIPFPGTWSTDARVCLLARAPRPVTILAGIVEVDLVE